MTRQEQLASNLGEVHKQIANACEAANRAPTEVTLIAVTKGWPVSDVQILWELGQRHFGESKDQEGQLKADRMFGRDLTWHFIGQVQRNKARSIARWAHIVHSLDRPELIPLLGQAAALIQVNLDQGTGRGGSAEGEVLDLAERVADSPLTLKGLMTIAPLHGDPDLWFSQLSRIHRTLLDRYPSARWLSAGMSGDFAAAIRHGATHVRIGTSILGSRPSME